MKYIYIVLIKAHTGLGKISRKISFYEYSHIAVSLKGDLKEFVTFSRRSHFNPMDAGFMYETRDCYAFGNHDKFKAKVFKLPVSSENMLKIEETVNEIEKDNDYIFNIFSMATMAIFHGFEIYKSHNCMSFTGLVLKLSQGVQMEKPYYKYSIKDMDELLSPYVHFEGYIKKRSLNKREYMKKTSPILLGKTGVTLIGKLIYRMILRGQNNE